jgi:signal peptide peptidase SppA
MLDGIPVADVPRLDDWFGVWAIELTRGTNLLAFVRDLDWPEHLARATQAPQPQAAADSFERVEVSGKTLAVIPLVGTLMKSRSSTGGTSTVDSRRKVRAAARDPEISGILLRVDSPGGTVAGTDALASEVAQARQYKPVLAQIEDVGASAAYWVASQASLVYASSATTLVGSIGTLYTVQRDGEVLGVFASGPLKAPGLDGTITEEQAAYLQGLVNDLQTQFSAAVTTGRRLAEEQIAAASSGAIWVASKAQDLRLIDGVQSLEKTLFQLASMR